MKKIICINRYFYPDISATSQLLTELALALAKESKYKVEIITSRQKYEDAQAALQQLEIYQNVTIRRIWTTSFGRANLFGRAIDYLTFYIFAMIELFVQASKEDWVLVKTDPPMLSIPAVIVANLKGANVINWLQDLYPEIIQNVSHNKAFTIAYDILLSIRNWSLKKSKMNVAIGEIMAEKLKAQQIENVTVIPNWNVGKELHLYDFTEAAQALRKEWGLEGKFIVGYSGNLGRAHDWELFIKAAENLKNDDKVAFLFIGGGHQYQKMMSIAKEKELTNIHFRPYQPLEKLGDSLSVPDVHMISLNPQMEGLIVPSKFYGVIAVGKPILYIGSGSGEIAKIITNNNIGAIIDPEDPGSLVKNIVLITSDTNEIKNLERIKALASKNYNRNSSVASWIKVLGKENY
jgi:colanic acid biosynthesis glycosyl transferase WcaI